MKKVLQKACQLFIIIMLPTYCYGDYKSVVRIISHGGSGTVIQSGESHSLILTCAHLFTNHSDQISQELLAKPLVIDTPVNYESTGTNHVGIKILKVDPKSDLALLEINTKLPFATPVAKSLATASTTRSNCISVGYDSMQNGTKETTSLVQGNFNHDGFLWTNESPIPGRSGGALFDSDDRLIGVCHGYTTQPGYHKGMYVSHDLIIAFLANINNPSPQAPFNNPSPQAPFNNPSPQAPFNKQIPRNQPYCPPGGS